MSNNAPFPILLARESAGEAVKHFSTVKNAAGEVKLFYTDSRLFVVVLDPSRNLVSFTALFRPQKLSLLGLEGSLETTFKQGVALGVLSQQVLDVVGRQNIVNGAQAA